MKALTTKTLQQLQQLLVKKEVSSTELVSAYYSQMETTEPKVHAYITLTREFAEQTAKLVDEARVRNEPLPVLAGLPMAVKDNISVKAERMTCASAILQNYIAPYDATVISKLSHCPILGKANLDEFAMGSATDTSYYGPTYNPLDVNRVPGGSSGGSAAAVAANMAAFALGSDTGGSIRQPASFTGTVGLKPTYGSISRYGMAAFASSLDQIGPITKTVADAKLVFDALCGQDEQDATSLSQNVKAVPQKKLRIGVVREYMENLPAYTKAAVTKAASFLQAQSYSIQEVSLPSVACGPQTYAVLTSAEAYSNLARYDGIRFGHSSENKASYEGIRGQLGREVKRRMLFGGFVLRSENNVAYYQSANALRNQICTEFAGAFETVDVLLCPTTSDEAFLVEEDFASAQEAYMRDYFCVSASLAGVPALSMPMGKGPNGMPLGLQLIANHNCEAVLFSVGTLLEAACYGK